MEMTAALMEHYEQKNHLNRGALGWGHCVAVINWVFK